MPDSISPAPNRGAIVALAFGTTVAMWAVGYVCRIPPARVPSPLLLAALLALVFAGGLVAGRTTGRGLVAGLATGLLAAALNMLILGSLLSGNTPGAITPSAIWWLPGALALGAGLGAAGGWFGARGRIERSREINWLWLLVVVDLLATGLLIGVGGLVTSWEAGLAVVDWPNSFGYNMFLYPLSRMTGGIYYEHAHRLFGSLVGLTTLVMVFRFFRDPRGRRWRTLATLALVMVVIQGLLGGLRVTGKLTLTTDPSQVAPSLTLAMIHGVFGQLFLSVLAMLAVVTSSGWTGATAHRSPSARLDRKLATGLTVLVIIQLLLGALVRHVESQQMDAGIVIHISMACLVAVATLIVALRAWGVHRQIQPLRRLGLWLLWIMPIQLTLGLGALVAVLFRGGQGRPSWPEVLVATAHQLNGALLLGLCVALACWMYRVLEPPENPRQAS